jgi:hypothetical protein
MDRERIEAYVDAAAPNPDAIKNGRGLVLKHKFVKFHISEDETILFGECHGSGKVPYQCSSDFARQVPAYPFAHLVSGFPPSFHIPNCSAPWANG